MNTCRSVLMHDLRVLASPMTEPRLGGSGKETVGGPKGPAGLAALGERKRSAVPSCQVVNQQASSRGFGNQAISASAYVVRVRLLWPHPRPLARASRVGRRRYEQIHCRRTRPSSRESQQRVFSGAPQTCCWGRCGVLEMISIILHDAQAWHALPVPEIGGGRTARDRLSQVGGLAAWVSCSGPSRCILTHDEHGRPAAATHQTNSVFFFLLSLFFHQRGIKHGTRGGVSYPLPVRDRWPAGDGARERPWSVLHQRAHNRGAPQLRTA